MRSDQKYPEVFKSRFHHVSPALDALPQEAVRAINGFEKNSNSMPCKFGR